MINALELFENFKNNQVNRALAEEKLRLAPLQEQAMQFALAKDAQGMQNENARLGILSRQQQAAEEMGRAKLGILAQAQANRPNPNIAKPPPGYRPTANGNLEAIPGGPADLKAQADAQKKATGVEDVDVALGTLRDAYDRLEKGGGITSTTNSVLGNLAASVSASPIGQIEGRVFGTQNQSARNDIAMARPALLAALMKATGMSAKQMDSNAELKLWLSTATDPTLDIQANRRALDNIEKKYISGRGGAPAAPSAPSGTPRSFKSEAEAAAAGIKPGTKVIINGAPGTWQ